MKLQPLRNVVQREAGALFLDRCLRYLKPISSSSSDGSIPSAAAYLRKSPQADAWTAMVPGFFNSKKGSKCSTSRDGNLALASKALPMTSTMCNQDSSAD